MYLIILRPSPPFGTCNISREDYLLYLDNAIVIEDSFFPFPAIVEELELLS